MKFITKMTSQAVSLFVSGTFLQSLKFIGRMLCVLAMDPRNLAYRQPSISRGWPKSLNKMGIRMPFGRFQTSAIRPIPLLFRIPTRSVEKKNVKCLKNILEQTSDIGPSRKVFSPAGILIKYKQFFEITLAGKARVLSDPCENDTYTDIKFAQQK